MTPTLRRWYGDMLVDVEYDQVAGVGHWIVEQAPELALDRLRAFMKL